MNRIGSLLACIAMSSALAVGCATTGTGFRVEADVRTLHAGSHDASGITAVAGAEVALQCPDASANRSLGKTDDTGSLRVDGEGAIPLACKVAITEAGYKPVALAVADLCTERTMGACSQISVRAMLAAEAH